MKIKNKRKLEINILTTFLIFFVIVLFLFIQTKEETVTYELCKNSKQEYYDFGNERISVICKINGEEKLISLFPNRSNVYIKELNGSRIPKLTDAVRIATVLNVSLDYLSGISELPKDRTKKVIPLEKALDFCEKERQRWHAYKLKALECKGYVESLGGAALGDQKEGMFGYEIPNILRLLCEDKEIL